MTTSDNQFFEAYLPVYDVVPDKWEDARPFLVEQMKRVSNAVNLREIGWFLDEELLSGKAFIPGTTTGSLSDTSQSYRQILRKVIDFGALPNATIKSVAHGIDFTANFTLIQIWASATDPTNFKAIPIPYVDATTPFPYLTALDNIQLDMDVTNVNITTTSDRRAFERCFVVIEYMQEL